MPPSRVEPRPGQTSSGPATTVQAPRPARVLIVNDNEDAAQSPAMLLEFEGYDVRVASDAEQGLAMLGDFDAQVAVLDIGLPGMDGHAMARALRAASRDRRIGLVALTGYGRPEDRRRALDAGFDEHMVKPVDFDALQRKIDSVVVTEKGASAAA